jgi:hypothetical protein
MRGLTLGPGAAGGAMVDESARAVDGAACDAVGASPSRLWDGLCGIGCTVDVDVRRAIVWMRPDEGGIDRDLEHKGGQERTSRCRNNLASLGGFVVPELQGSKASRDNLVLGDSGRNTHG